MFLCITSPIRKNILNLTTTCRLRSDFISYNNFKSGNDHLTEQVRNVKMRCSGRLAHQLPSMIERKGHSAITDALPDSQKTLICKGLMKRCKLFLAFQPRQNENRRNGNLTFKQSCRSVLQLIIFTFSMLVCTIEKWTEGNEYHRKVCLKCFECKKNNMWASNTLCFAKGEGGQGRIFFIFLTCSSIWLQGHCQMKNWAGNLHPCLWYNKGCRCVFDFTLKKTKYCNSPLSPRVLLNNSSC